MTVNFIAKPGCTAVKATLVWRVRRVWTATCGTFSGLYQAKSHERFVNLLCAAGIASAMFSACHSSGRLVGALAAPRAPARRRVSVRAAGAGRNAALQCGYRDALTAYFAAYQAAVRCAAMPLA